MENKISKNKTLYNNHRYGSTFLKVTPCFIGKVKYLLQIIKIYWEIYKVTYIIPVFCSNLL
ncbi:hypothetical protein COV24_04575 [candidate division WWE3 bacterium CG10_big_fil_rev_8_21_14_0_10_32_10]|uniref:Uncharacterized protein n=1 Tax=candidate division WWE3 bacterium CG10_big_fil_rev_8_21_14_0_10_32_10 TaxID=1975090 RepID=A0A2H0R9B9_UNCKA|nr:MAG: hypothetical protein COV24_04575 [candidate division WWE3 bacterium CG10_big_fil_rev_8_21_14_0_10_32_10]